MSNSAGSKARVELEKEYLDSLIKEVKRQNKAHFLQKAVELMRRENDDFFSKCSLNLLIANTPKLTREEIKKCLTEFP